MKIRYRAFTLAEVLITLSIIGVVAAMTIPVLINKIGDTVLNTQNKKAQAILANGIKMLMAKEEVMSLEDTALKGCGDDKGCIANEIKSSFKVLEDNSTSDDAFNGKYQFTNQENYEIWQDSGLSYVFSTPDGMIFGLMKNSEDNDNYLNVIADINGTKSPNKGGKDLCKYLLTQTASLSENCTAMEEFTPTSQCTVGDYAKCNESECLALNNIDLMAQGGTVSYIWFNNKCKRSFNMTPFRK